MPTVHFDYNSTRNYFVVSFPFDKDLVNFFHRLSDRRWDDARRVYTVPAVVENYSMLQTLRSPMEFSPSAQLKWDALVEEAKQLKEHCTMLNTGVPTDAYIGYDPKTKPMKHQIEAFNLFRERRGGALLFEQGLGKTKSAIDLANYAIESNQIDKVLVLCPSFVKYVWEKEIGLHSKLSMPVHLINGEQGKRRIDILELATQQKHCWVVTNYEELISQIYFMFLGYVSKSRVLIIADESTKIKNRAAKTTKRAVELAKLAKKLLILSGTPVANNPLDLWSQFVFLRASLGFANFIEFRNKYATMGGYGGYEVVEWKNLDDLQERIRPYSLRRTKEECLDLPQKIYQKVYIDLPAELRDAYDQMHKNSFLELREEAAERGGQISATNVLSKMVRLSQIVGSTLKLPDGTPTRFKATPKLDALFDILDSIDPTHGVIVWAQYKEEVRMIGEALTKKGISNSLNYGETAKDVRKENMEDFQSGKTRVFVANSALAYGVTLTRASYAIFYSNSYSYTNRYQSEDRCHRIGTSMSPTYIDLIARNTVDQLVINALASKKDLAAFILDRKVNPFKGEKPTTFEEETADVGEDAKAIMDSSPM